MPPCGASERRGKRARAQAQPTTPSYLLNFARTSCPAIAQVSRDSGHSSRLVQARRGRGPRAENATKSRFFKPLNGGGRSPDRTSLHLKFPANREINRKFCRFRLDYAILASSRRAQTNNWHPIF